MNDEDLRSLFVGYGTYHFYQVLVKDVKSNPDHLRVLEQWFQCYWPWEMSFAKKGILAHRYHLVIQAALAIHPTRTRQALIMRYEGRLAEPAALSTNTAWILPT